MPRRLPLVLAALTLALVVPGSAAGAAGRAASHQAAAAATARAATGVVHVRPLDASGQLLPGYHVAHHFGRSSCFLGGIADTAAYRCFAGNNIFDPCWRESPTSSYVDCLVTPWRHDVARLHATKGIDDSLGATRNRQLWGLQLRNGLRCVGSQGASGVVDGQGISFFCLHSSTVLVGTVDRSAAVWRIRIARTSDGGLHYRLGKPHRIARAYVGKPSLHS